MAKNSLGEIIGKPGAHHREMAAVFGRYSDSQEALANTKDTAAIKLYGLIGLSHDRADAARVLPASDRKRSPGDYVRDARELRAQAEPQAAEAAAHASIAREFASKARKSTRRAKIQTFAAKIGIPQSWIPD